MEIRYLKREEIDKTKWNSCVHYANTGNVMGYMWYLDQLSKEWDALVEGDYESVLPLFWRSGRFGGVELYQPDLSPNVGIYTINVLSPKRVNAFLEAIPSRFNKIAIQLNEKTYPPEEESFQVSKLLNHQLMLNQPFEGLYQNFSSDLQETISKAEESGLYPGADLKPEILADFYLKYASERKGLTRNFHALQRIMWNALHRGWGFASGIKNSSHELLAVDFFIYSHGKVQSIMPTVSPQGKKEGALAYLYYMMLRKNANSPLILDFNTNKENMLAKEMGAKTKTFYRLEKKRKVWSLFK